MEKEKCECQKRMERLLKNSGMESVEAKPVKIQPISWFLLLLGMAIIVVAILR